MISGARRPRARCAVSDRRLAEATAACKTPSAAPRTAVGGVGSAIGEWRARCGGSRAWTRPLTRPLDLRPSLQESDGPLLGSGQPKSICEWARRSVREWAKLPSPARRKNANADRLVTLHAKFISSHGWFAQGK